MLTRYETEQLALTLHEQLAALQALTARLRDMRGDAVAHALAISIKQELERAAEPVFRSAAEAEIGVPLPIDE